MSQLDWLKLLGFALAAFLHLLLLYEGKGGAKGRAISAATALFFVGMTIWYAAKAIG